MKYPSLRLNPQGTRRRGRSQNTCRRSTEADEQQLGLHGNSYRRYPKSDRDDRPLLATYAPTEIAGFKAKEKCFQPFSITQLQVPIQPEAPLSRPNLSLSSLETL